MLANSLKRSENRFIGSAVLLYGWLLPSGTIRLGVFGQGGHALLPLQVRSMDLFC